MSYSTLEFITDGAALLAKRRERLASLVNALNKGIEALKTDAMPELRKAINDATESWKALEANIIDNPTLFASPRTVTAHGIKFGLAKGKGTVEIGDDAKTIRLIKKHFPEQVDTLIDTKETPSKDALFKLPAADLKRLGCELKGTGDRVVIKLADGEVDKIVKALVSAKVDEDEVAP